VRAPYFLLTIALAVIACSKTDDPPNSNAALMTCMPNQVLVCLCGLDEGTQTCTEDRKLTPCDCSHTQDGRRPPGPTPQPPESKCGNGRIEPGEACDDGNTVDGDGCSAKCQPDGDPKDANVCPGQAVRLWKGSPLLLTGTTDGYSDELRASCFDSTGPDRVYAIQPSADGTLEIDAAFSPDFNAVVEIRRDNCALADASVMCEDTQGQSFTRALEVEKDKTYFLVIDGDFVKPKGKYTIRVELP
jgi:cysteine-rich repeat protein